VIKPIWADNCGMMSSTATAMMGGNPVIIADFGMYISGSFPVGTTTITFVGTDNSGNTSTCLVHIKVEDMTPPTINNCPGNITTSAAFNACTKVVTWTPPTAFDNCSGVTLVQTSSPAGYGIGSAFPIGTTTITYTATDASGNVTICIFTVTVTGTCANPTEFTPTFLIDASNFITGQARDAIYIVENVSGNPSNTQVQILITRPNSSFFTTFVPAMSATSNVFGGIMSNNTDWTFSYSGDFIVCTKASPIAAGASSIISLTFTAIGTSGSQAQTTGQILNGSGGDQNPNNNFAQSSLIIN
jgi:hypothetical protein